MEPRKSLHETWHDYSKGNEEQSPVDRKLEVGDKVAPLEGTKPPDKVGRLGKVIHISENGESATVKFSRVTGTFFYRKRELLIQTKIL